MIVHFSLCLRKQIQILLASSLPCVINIFPDVYHVYIHLGDHIHLFVHNRDIQYEK